MTKSLWVQIVAVHAFYIFFFSSLMTITKWFPYGSVVTGLREWLYTFF
ncbi:MAG: hypothetical protein ACOCW2_01545 [Chitinivibrionales bacterium]